MGGEVRGGGRGRRQERRGRDVLGMGWGNRREGARGGWRARFRDGGGLPELKTAG